MMQVDKAKRCPELALIHYIYQKKNGVEIFEKVTLLLFFVISEGAEQLS